MISLKSFFLSFLFIPIFTFSQESIESSNLYSEIISLNISDDKKYSSQKLGGLDLVNGSFSWNGKLIGGEVGFLSFANVTGYLNGSLIVPNGDFYTIRGRAGNL